MGLAPLEPLVSQPALVGAILGGQAQVVGSLRILQFLKCLRALLVVGEIRAGTPRQADRSELERLEVELLDIDPAVIATGEVERPDEQIGIVVSVRRWFDRLAAQDELLDLVDVVVQP